MDQKLASESALNITSRSHEKDVENDHRAELSNTDRGHLLQSDPESNSTIQGKSLFSSSLKQHLFDGSLTEECLQKIDSFNRWMSKELGDVRKLHMPSSSGVYWETIENENGIEDSNIPPCLDAYMLDPSISQDQLYSIIDFSPNWAYVGSEVKVLITGRFLICQQEAENNNWSCMFGEVEVPAEILAGGVLRCHTPAQKAGRVPFYVTCSNKLACSELQEFEYRENNVQDVDLTDNSGNITSESLYMRFGKLLCQSSERTPNYDPSKVNEISELRNKISLLLEKDNDDWDEIFTLQENFSVEKAKEKLLKEKLHVWLLQKVAEDGKGPSVLDPDGQGVLHFAAALGYDWALEPTVVAGVNINFPDVNGWTALQWAAHCGRERTVAFLISLGATVGALSDPTPKYPSGQTPADLASAIGRKGYAGSLAESDFSDLFSRLSYSTSNKKDGKASEFSGENAVQTVSHRSPASITDEDLRYGLSMKDSLAAVCKPTQAAAINQVFRVQSFQKKQLKEYGNDTFGMSDERALSLVAGKSHKAGHRDEPVHAATIRVQNKFRSWKSRKDFSTIRQQIVKIQDERLWSIAEIPNTSKEVIDISSQGDKLLEVISQGEEDEIIDLTTLKDSPTKPPPLYTEKVIWKDPLIHTSYTNPIKLKAKRQIQSITSSVGEREASFLTWYTGAAASDTHDVYSIGVQSKAAFWHKVVELREWLTNNHIDSFLALLRRHQYEQQAIVPQSWTTTHTFFVGHIKMEYERWRTTPSNKYKWPKLFTKMVKADYTPGLFYKPWGKVKRVFIPINFDNAHWVAGVLNFHDWSITVYDSETTYTGKYDRLVQRMRPYTIFIPALLAAMSFRATTIRTPRVEHLALRRVEGVPQQGQGSNDCGIFMLCFIECLALSRRLDFSHESSALMRQRLATQLYFHCIE
ncbi:calmodulin-binding transcription activator 3-like [Mangifera indica]|uniref:calmodulin-binding transcription activator 3-like n=1 Tax=Mangifera indica TaxID=29780 RepID=UPI001CFB9172|nr:calmodulin-binding transcription activator 3-like [Mangifera indica]